MTNQQAGTVVLKGGLLQCYQLQAWVYRLSNRDGDRTLLSARLGTGLPSEPALLSFVTGGFVWLPPVGKETHSRSSSLPLVNIYVTSSPAWLKVALPMGGDGFDGIRTPEQPKVHHGASWPLVFLSRARDTDIIEVVVNRFSRGHSKSIVPRVSWQLGPVSVNMGVPLWCPLDICPKILQLCFKPEPHLGFDLFDLFTYDDRESFPNNVG